MPRIVPTNKIPAVGICAAVSKAKDVRVVSKFTKVLLKMSKN